MPQDPLPSGVEAPENPIPRDVLDLVGSLSLHGLGGKPGKKASRVDVASVAARTAAGISVLADLDSAVPKLLQRIRVPSAAPGTVQLLNEAFPTLRRRVGAVADEVWRDRLQSALERFVQASTLTPNPIVGRNLACTESPKATVAQLAASVGVASTRMAKTLDQMTEGAVATRVTASGRVRRVVIGDRSAEIKEALARPMSCKTAGRRLSISAKRVSVLKDEGLLVSMTEAGIQRFLGGIPDVEIEPSLDTVALSEALRTLVRVDRTGAFVRSLFARTLACSRVVATPSGALSLNHWRVSREEVKAWASAAREDDLSVPQAAKALGVKQEVAYHLVRTGLLASAVRRGPARSERVVALLDLQRFSRHCRPLSELAREAGVGARGAVEWAESQGHRIVCGPTIDGCRQYFVDLTGGKTTTFPQAKGAFDD